MKNRLCLSSKIRSIILLGGLMAVSVIGVVSLQLPDMPSRNQETTLSEYQEEETETSLQLSFLKRVPSLGFSNLLADWIYLQYIQYFGDSEAREETGYDLIPDYFDGVVERDPHFIRALLMLEVGNSLFAGQPQSGVNLLDKALEKISPKFITEIGPFHLWRTKGNDELLFLGEVDAAKQSYAKSIEWAKYYDDEDSQKIARISRGSIDFLNKNPDSKTARIGAWVSVLSNRPDQKTIERVIKEIERLGGTVRIMPNGQITVSTAHNSD